VNILPYFNAVLFCEGMEQILSSNWKSTCWIIAWTVGITSRYTSEHKS
jgi:hypothetical protein